MKKILFPALFIIILIFSLISCSFKSQQGDTSDSLLASFESQISDLKQFQSEYESSQKNIYNSLDSALDAFLSHTESNTTSTDSITEAPSKGFLYTVENGKATIRGYVGDEEHLVIPSSIDGYDVHKISDNAFSGSKLKSVIISDGIESIGWFAFDGCVFLSAITVPSSVTSIGYSALGPAASDLTVYCHNGSFAMKFAQSFGFSYAVI